VIASMKLSLRGGVGGLARVQKLPQVMPMMFFDYHQQRFQPRNPSISFAQGRAHWQSAGGLLASLLLEFRLPPLMWKTLTRLSGMTFQQLIKSFLWILSLSQLLGQGQGRGEEAKIPLRMVAFANVEGHLGLRSSM